MTEDFDSAPFDFLDDRFLIFNNAAEKGDDVQKFSVLQTLPQLLETEPRATICRLIPKILQELPNSSCEFHIMCSKVFRILIQQKASINLLNAVLQGIEAWDPIVASAWMEALISVIEYLSDANVKSEIIPLAHTKALLTMPITSRIASCKILGKVAVHKSLTSNDVKRDVLPLVQSLCQDCNADVRAAICLQLPQIAQGLGTDSAKESLMVCLVELASDDIINVKASAISIIVCMFSHTTPEMMKSTVLPLVVQVCSHVLTTDDITAVSISKELGNLLEGLKSFMTEGDYVWFLNFYKSLCHRGLVTGPVQFRSADVSFNVVCRENAAGNLPLVTKFVLNSLPGQLDALFAIIRDLASDPCYLVRQMVANCFLELMTAFGVQCKALKQEVTRLLRDDSEEVLQKIVPHISGILQLLGRYSLISPDSLNAYVGDIGRALLKCYFDLGNGYNWRLLTNFLFQLESLPNNVSSEYIHQHFTPVVLTSAVHGKGKPVRTQAARTLLVFLRYNKKEMQKRWLRENLISQLCQSPSSYTRLIYIRLCQNAMELFSEKYFKQHFLEGLLSLADDPVANVRLCVVNMFPVLKQMLTLPNDRVLHEKLESIFLKYKADEKDRDVISVYQKQLKLIVNYNRNIDKEAHAKEQKRLQDEEESDQDVKSSVNQQITVTRRNIPPKKHLRNSISQSGGRTQSQPRPIITTEQQNSTMPFLEQNFYVDAGISLATTLSKQSVDVEEKFPLLNITDDDKVTLRNTTRNKRFSSILSATCLESTPKPINRRSLNIETKRIISKIPISSISNINISSRTDVEMCNKAVDIYNEFECSNSNAETLENNGTRKSSCSLQSHLPVLKRRTKSQIRKDS